MRLIVCVALSALLTGCAVSVSSIGNDFAFQSVKQVKRGVSHKADVSRILGAPYCIETTDVSETWTYSYQRSVGAAVSAGGVTAGSGSILSKNAWVVFDTSDVVTSVSTKVIGSSSDIKTPQQKVADEAQSKRELDRAIERQNREDARR